MTLAYGKATNPKSMRAAAKLHMLKLARRSGDCRCLFQSLVSMRVVVLAATLALVGAQFVSDDELGCAIDIGRYLRVH